MELHSRLVHAEPGHRVVAVRALEQGRSLGSAVGEGPTAEAAEDRAIARLLARLQEPQRAPASPPADAPAAASAAPIRPDSAPAAAAATAPAAPPEGSALPPSAPGPAPAAASPRPTPDPTAPARNAAPAPPAAPAAGTAPAPNPASAPPAATPSAPPAAAPVAPPPGMEPPMEPPPREPPSEPQPDPEDWSGELVAIDRAIKRLGWTREQEAVYLERAFGHPSRSRLTTYADLLAYLRALEAMAEGDDPSQVAVPLRRRDLLAQSDQLLQQLGWGAEQGREFLERHLSASSRQQLRDEQLLQFNLLLEEALLGGGG